MFSKLKHRFGAKSKKAVALLTMAALLCGFTGCGKNETGSSAPLSSSSVPQIVPTDKSDVSQNLVISSDNTDSLGAQGGGQSDFVFDEAVKNITLFGQTISLPCTIAEFGEDFSLSTEPFDKPLSSGENRVACNLLYKDLKIATVAIADRTPDDDYNEGMIDTIMLGFSVDYSNWSKDYKNKYFESSGWYPDLIEVEIGGISLESSEEAVKSILGVPTTEQPYFESGKELVYTFFRDDEKRLEKSIVFRFLKNNLVGMNINFVEK